MAQNTCGQLQAAIANSNAPSSGFNWNNVTPGGLITSLGNAFGSHNQTQTFNTNINNTSISTTDITDIFNSCSNTSSAIQANNITSSPACIESVGKICNGNFACIKNLLSVSDVNQENSKTVNQDCLINSLIKTISSKDVSLENAAQLLTLQNAKGLMTHNENLTSNCNQVNTNISSNSFLNAISHCANKSASEQINNITACGNNVSGISQKNQGDEIYKCYIEQGIFTENNTNVKSFNKANITTKQKADSSMSSMFLIIIIIVFVISGVVAFIMIQNKKKQQMH
jgi:hypothetical protein